MQKARSKLIFENPPKNPSKFQREFVLYNRSLIWGPRIRAIFQLVCCSWVVLSAGVVADRFEGENNQNHMYRSDLHTDLSVFVEQNISFVSKLARIELISQDDDPQKRSFTIMYTIKELSGSFVYHIWKKNHTHSYVIFNMLDAPGIKWLHVWPFISCTVKLAFERA